MTAKPIQIDLRRDLPKVREQLEAILPRMGACLYASPCAVGVMIPKTRRAALDRREWKGVGAILEAGAITAPLDQWEDLGRLQSAFDLTTPGHFKDVLADLEAKYLSV